MPVAEKKSGRKRRADTPSPYTTLLINRAAAFIRIELGTNAELARFAGVTNPRVCDWLKRKVQPGYEYGKNIEGWIDLKEKELASEKPARRAAYAAAFQEIEKQYPHENS